MKSICRIALAIAVMSFSLIGIAHEDHDHNAVSALKAPKGGLMKSREESHIEVVAKGQNLKIYFYDKDLKPQNVEAFKVTA